MCDEIIYGTHIKFVPGEPKPKTKTWFVVNKYEELCVGNIGWFARWRKYAFFPLPGMVFEETCLREIASFCESQTINHRRQK
jgi:hypothetical protein